NDQYKKTCQAIIARRMKALTKGLGVDLPDDGLAARYYVELDLLAWAQRHWGAEFASWMKANYEPVDAIFRLAELDSVVLLNGGGFDGPQWSVRVSLANLPMDAYERIGSALWDIGQEYKAAFDARKGG
ncbi:MAG: aspartate 4-decarboxylase, partial [Stackebrandtia sp.]